MKLPAQALRARLANIRPIGNRKRWEHTSRDKLLSLVSDRPLIALVTNVDQVLVIVFVVVVIFMPTCAIARWAHKCCFLSIHLSVRLTLWDLRCAPVQQYRATLWTAKLHCAQGQGQRSLESRPNMGSKQRQVCWTFVRHKTNSFYLLTYMGPNCHSWLY